MDIPLVEKQILQIIDVSDRILHNEVKADKLLLTLINGAVSHELRNPLNALVA
jgi:signal transduction histidine kinase